MDALQKHNCKCQSMDGWNAIAATLAIQMAIADARGKALEVISSAILKGACTR
ncbi:hypothetical protein [Altericista sp. CCNU0014]|uniref:hypothetical protein n=1 Tax=Altericista sp. CCNU0014 TaxID=3082949 RepID=UPI00384C16DC